MYDTIKIKD